MDEVQLEHRLDLIEAAIKSGAQLQATELRTLTVEVAGMKEQVKTQNGRITTLERAQHMVDRISDVAQGKAELSRAQLTGLIVLAPFMFTSVNIILRLSGY